MPSQLLGEEFLGAMEVDDSDRLLDDINELFELINEVLTMG